MSDFLLDFDRYFCRYRKPIFECPDGAIYQKLGKEVNIYRKGIRCFETHKESCFDYDLYNVRLDENRRVWGTWEMWEQMWKVILQCPNSSIIRRFLNNLAAGEFVEHEISSSIVSISRDWFVQEAVWEEAIGDNYVVSSGMWNFLSPEEQAKTFLVPRGLWIYLTEFFKDRYTPPGIRTNDGNVTYKVIPANEVDSLHRVMLDQVLDFFKQCNFKVPYPIKIARIDEKHILGTIEKEEQAIILGTLALETGKDEVAKTIIEETIHLHYKVADCTRAFQNASIMLLLNYMKQQNVIIL